MDIINESLRCCINNMRKRFRSLDLVNQNIIACLREVKGVRYFEDKRRDQIVFALPLTSLTTKISYPCGGVSLQELVRLSNHESEDPLQGSFIFLVNALSNQGFDCKRLIN